MTVQHPQPQWLQPFAVALVDQAPRPAAALLEAVQLPAVSLHLAAVPVLADTNLEAVLAEEDRLQAVERREVAAVPVASIQAAAGHA